jgi:transcriptional regulator of heat shock response
VLSQRQEVILKLLIEDYIRTAQPVGSKYLNKQYNIGVSDATVRNELAALEHMGFIRAPHTSAGRIPTENGYVYYLQNLRNKKFELKGAPLKDMAQPGTSPTEQSLKRLAKRLSELSGETALVSIDQNWTYQVGVSNLFSKPDFASMELVQGLSQVVDQFDEVMTELYGHVPDVPKVYVGSENPFGDQISAVVVSYTLRGNEKGMIGLLGPLRMNYSKNIALLERAKQLIDESDL